MTIHYENLRLTESETKGSPIGMMSTYLWENRNEVKVEWIEEIKLQVEYEFFYEINKY